MLCSLLLEKKCGETNCLLRGDEKLFDGEFSEFMEKTGCKSMDEMFERLQAEDKGDERVGANVHTWLRATRRACSH